MKIGSQSGDGELLRRVTKGDEEAFLTLYRRHQAALFRFALRMTGSAWYAEEVVQDAFLTLLRAPGKYDPSRGNLGAYLFGIARNHAMKRLERTPHNVSLDEQTESGHREDILAVDSFTPADGFEQKDRAERVRAAVLELPPEFREAVVLCELEGFSYEEAAQTVGCPIGTIRSRLHRARALLLAKLEMLRDAPRKAGIGR